MKQLSLLAAAVALGGCVSSQEVADTQFSKYVGTNVDAFFIANGAPVQKHQLNNGDLLWVWDSGVTSVYMPATTNITGTNYGGQANYTAWWCRDVHASRRFGELGEIREKLLLTASPAEW
jgi:hypothetical protein